MTQPTPTERPLTQPIRHAGSPPAPLPGRRPIYRALGRSARAGVALALLALVGGTPRLAHAAPPTPPPSTTGHARPLLSSGVEVGRQPDGSVVVPTDQVITPAGQQVEFSGRPSAVAVSPDGTTAAYLTAGAGAGGGSITLVDLATGAIKQAFSPGDRAASFDGLLYAPDGRHLYAAFNDGKILIADVAADGTLSLGALVALPPVVGVPAPGGNASTSNPGGLALSPDGATLYVALNRTNALGVIDLARRTLVAQIPVGNAPHSVVVDGETAYVSDEGGRVAATGDVTNTSSGTAIVANPTTGGAATGAISVVDLAARATTRTIAVGLHPTALYLDRQALFVANTNGDSVSVISPTMGQVVKTIAIQPFPGAPFGSQPTALTRLPDGRLVVSLGSNNALAVYTYQDATRPATFDGLLPVGWFPGGLALDQAHGRLVVANVKGVGSLGPTQTIGSSADTSRTGKSPYAYQGSTSLVPYPTAADLAAGATQVARNNGWDHLDTAAGDPSAAPRAIPLHVGDPSTIKHVFYIIKENRTYDQVLGDDTRGNGDPTLTVFGRAVTPNEHALVQQFPLFDNLYDSGVLSADGHQWAMQALAPDYLEKTFGGFVRSYPYNAGDALAYLPSGFIWENALRHGESVRNYGEYANQFGYSGAGTAPPFGSWSDWYRDAQILSGAITGTLHAPLGTFQTRSDVPSNDPLLNRDFPPFNTGIPDQYRAEIFLRDFRRYVADGDLPRLNVMELPDDHTSGTSAGYPTPRAQAADNDLALGRMVDAISHSPYWKDSAIFVVEDDAQNGVDHVDGHRTTGYAISPYAKHGIVDRTYYTQVDIVRTIEQILGLPAMNQLDLAATPMYNAFADTPDLAPYTAVSNTVPLDELNPTPAPSPTPPATPATPATTPAAGTPTATTTPASGGGGGGSATPELGSGELLGGGLVALGLIAWRLRRRKPGRGEKTIASTTIVALLLLGGVPLFGRPAQPARFAPGARPVVGARAVGHAPDGVPTARTRALQAAWAETSTRMVGGTASFVPDMANPRLLNRAIWYSVKGYTTPYPGDTRVLMPQEVLAQDHYLWQLRPDLGTRRLGGSQAHR